MTDRHWKSALDKEVSAKLRYYKFIVACIIDFYHFVIIEGITISVQIN